ncbi:hypothetical protein VTL71DRAFT_11477 [Oculimacula yallundae]|uniref:Uncharacterized protein n=1 Tax=Oculimacula yallundae TaxID=86028 RepID=A0ABR4CQM9_9HELO
MTKKSTPLPSQSDSLYLIVIDIAVQDKATNTVRIVPRRRTDLNDPVQRWTLIRSSGTSSDTKFTEGTYTISLFASPNPKDAQSRQEEEFKFDKADRRAEQERRMEDENKKYLDALQIISDRFKHLPSNIRKHFHGKAPFHNSPPMHDTIKVDDIISLLSGSDYRNAQAAVGIANWVVENVADKNRYFHNLPQTLNQYDPDRHVVTFGQSTAQIASQVSEMMDTSPGKMKLEIQKGGLTLLQALDQHIKTLPCSCLSSFSSSKPPTLSTVASTYHPNERLHMEPLDAQDSEQLFIVASCGDDNFIIRNVQFFLYLYLTGTGQSSYVAGLSYTPQDLLMPVPKSSAFPENLFKWKIKPQRLGGYAISTQDSQYTVAFEPGSANIQYEPLIPDGTLGYQKQRFNFRRTGYYLQNQSADAQHQVLGTSPGQLGVGLRLFPAFGQNRKEQGMRGDALCIWNIMKVSGSPLYRIQNEAKNVFLMNNGRGGVEVNGDPASKAGKRDDLKGWKFVPVNTVERGHFLNLPRFALLYKDGSKAHVLAAKNDWTAGDQVGFGPAVYKPGDSFARWRAIFYGDHIAFLNEATGGVLSLDPTLTRPGTVSALDMMYYQWAWFKADPKAGGELSSLHPDKDVFCPITRMVSNTGDLLDLNTSVRIQIADGIQAGAVNRLAVRSDVVGSALDVHRLAFRYVQRRYYIHVDTKQKIGSKGLKEADVICLLGRANYEEYALWKVTTTPYSSPASALDGFYPLKVAYGQDPAPGATVWSEKIRRGLSIRSDNTLIADKREDGILARIIHDSHSQNLTTQLTALNTFIKTRLPVFCFGFKKALPTNIDWYLEHCQPSDFSGHHYNWDKSIPFLSNFDKQTDAAWTMNFSLPDTTDATIAKAYVTVQEADDPVNLNYTDFKIHLLIPQVEDSRGGWQHLTTRINNESNNTHSVFFPGSGWIRNLDLNYSSLIIPDLDNPLKILKRFNGTSKLHVYVDAKGRVSPTVPADKVKTNADIIDDGKWALALDAGEKALLLRADMVDDGDGGKRPHMPAWAMWDGDWTTATADQLDGKPTTKFETTAGSPDPFWDDTHEN